MYVNNIPKVLIQFIFNLKSFYFDTIAFVSMRLTCSMFLTGDIGSSALKKVCCFPYFQF